MFPTSFVTYCLLILAALHRHDRLYASACDAQSFPPVYASYPDCAASCLACPDTDYVNNFAHNCDYATGDCCRSKYHTVIAATWTCVAQSCTGPADGDMALAQQAFDTFGQFCNSVNVPLAAVDVPDGYTLGSVGAGNGNGNGNGTAGSGSTGAGSENSEPKGELYSREMRSYSSGLLGLYQGDSSMPDIRGRSSRAAQAPSAMCSYYSIG
jgi:hypothetical protein